jgi:hypothetical protein
VFSVTGVVDEKLLTLGLGFRLKTPCMNGLAGALGALSSVRIGGVYGRGVRTSLFLVIGTVDSLLGSGACLVDYNILAEIILESFYTDQT